MSGSSPSGAGNSTSLAIVYSEPSLSVSGSSNSSVPPSSTLFRSSLLSSSTADSVAVAAANTPHRLLTTSQSPQTATSSASSLSPPNVGHVGSSSSTASATTTFTAVATVTKGFDASYAVGSSDDWSRSTSFWMMATRSGFTILISSASSFTYSPAHASAASDTSTIWTASFANHRDHATGSSTLNSAPETIPTITPVSSSFSKVTTGTESTSTSTSKGLPKAPKQIVSPPITVLTQFAESGSVLLTTITSETPISIPTTSSIVSPNRSSNSNSLLPLILGPVLGVLVIAALGMIAFRCCARRRSKNASNALASGTETWGEQKDLTMEETPWVNAVTLGRRITSYRGSSTYTAEHMATCISQAGESSQISNGQFSDPFADSLDVVSSRTSVHPASTLSVDSMSTNLAFTTSVNADPWDAGELESSIDASTSSLELHFVAPPVVTNDSPTQSLYLSPSWDYDGQSSASSPREGEHCDEGRQGETSSLPTSPLASQKPFSLGTGSARLRLHALLKEARRI